LVLYVGDRQRVVISCYVGHSVWLEQHKLCINEVDFVYADGDEYEWVKKNFVNLPYNRFRSCNWFGNEAKMIASSLYYLKPNLPVDTVIGR
jgi:hypothetical protein